MASHIHYHIQISEGAASYLASRLEGARGLYLLALAVGKRGDDTNTFGRMIREARIHFSAVIEEARLAGLDTHEMAAVLSDSSVNESLRPDALSLMEGFRWTPVAKGDLR